jgi:hypothetical protein
MSSDLILIMIVNVYEKPTARALFATFYTLFTF